MLEGTYMLYTLFLGSDSLISPWALFPVLVVQASLCLNNLCPTITSPLFNVIIDGAASPPAQVLHELCAHTLPGQDGNDSWSKTPCCEV